MHVSVTLQQIHALVTNPPVYGR